MRELLLQCCYVLYYTHQRGDPSVLPAGDYVQLDLV
jgi:hypothetical protein